MTEAMVHGQTGVEHTLVRCDWCGWLLGCTTCEDVPQRVQLRHEATGETVCGQCFKIAAEGVTLP